MRYNRYGKQIKIQKVILMSLSTSGSNSLVSEQQDRLHYTISKLDDTT
jgi:hypothetical protein